MFTWNAAAGVLLATGVASIVMAVLLGARSMGSHPARWFGLFLLLTGMGYACNSLVVMAQQDDVAYGLKIAEYSLRFAAMCTLAWFLATYPRRRVHSAVGLALAVCCSVWLLALWLNPSWLLDASFNYAWPLGWSLILLEPALLLGAFGAGWRLLASRGVRADVLLLLVAGLLIHGAFHAGRQIPVMLRLHGSPALASATWQVTYAIVVAQLIGLALIFGLAALLLWRGRRRDGLWIGGLAATAMGLGFYANGMANGFWGDVTTALPDRWGLVLTFAALPAVVGYAILRCEMFDVRFRAKRLVGQSSLLASVGLLFWFVATVIGVWLEPLFALGGVWPDVLAGALVATAFKPLQALASKLANRMFPEARPARSMPVAERRHLYEEQVQLAWDDHHIGEKERCILDNLAAHLQLAKDDVLRIEGRVISA